jgi:uncharacterized membrane-anchored protein YitT (DUF2179 family)
VVAPFSSLLRVYYLFFCSLESFVNLPCIVFYIKDFASYATVFTLTPIIMGVNKMPHADWTSSSLKTTLSP